MGFVDVDYRGIKEPNIASSISFGLKNLFSKYNDQKHCTLSPEYFCGRIPLTLFFVSARKKMIDMCMLHGNSTLANTFSHSRNCWQMDSGSIRLGQLPVFKRRENFNNRFFWDYRLI